MRSLALLLCFTACGSPKVAAHSPALSVRKASTVPAVPVPATCTSPASGRTSRDAAVLALVAANTSDALFYLQHEVKEHPDDIGAYALITATHAMATAAWTETSHTLETAHPLSVSEPLSGHVVHRPLVLPSGPPLTLGAFTETTFTGTPEEEVWRKGGRSQIGLDEEEAAASPHIAEATLTRSFHEAGAQTFLFGEWIVGARISDKDPMRLFHVEGGALPISLVSAGVAGGAIIAQVLQKGTPSPPPPSDARARGSEASPTAPTATFFEAFNAESGEVRWVSDPLTGSVTTPLLAGEDAIFATSDTGGSAIHVLSLTDGRTMMHTSIPLLPEYIVANGDRIEVIAADEELEIATNGTLQPPPPAGLPLPNSSRDPREARELACVLRRTLAALDRRNGDDARSELNAAGLSKDPPVVALSVAADFLLHQTSDPTSVVDLTAVPPITIDPANREPQSAAPAVAHPPHLRRIPRAAPRRMSRAPNQVAPPDVPSMDGLPTVTFEMPDNYAGESVFRDLALPEGSVIVYGDHYVAVLDGMRTRAVFDMARVLRMGAVGTTELTLGAIEPTASRLFVGVGAQEPTQHDDDAVYAIETSTGKVAWTAPGLGPNFVRSGDFLIAPNRVADGVALAVVSPDSGAVLSSERLRARPTAVGYMGSEILVQFTGGDFELFEAVR